MSIRRGEKRRAASVPLELLRNERLSWRAKGLAAFLLSKHHTWRIDARALGRMGKEGRDAVLAALKELEDEGYLVRRRIQGEAGRWFTESVLYEDPADAIEAEATEDGFPGPGQPGPGEPEPGGLDLLPSLRETDHQEQRAELDPEIAEAFQLGRQAVTGARAHLVRTPDEGRAAS